MSHQMQVSRKARLLRWVTPPAPIEYPVLQQNDGLVLPAGQVRYFSESECEEIIRIGDNYRMNTATTGDGSDRITYTNRNTMVCTMYPDVVTSWIYDKLEVLVGRYLSHFRFDVVGFYEGIQLYRYPTGGFLNPHMDIGKGYMSTRKLGITVQLSAAGSYEGGDLEFISSENLAPRELGTVVIFPTFMLHRVRPVTRGERISLVSWVHGHPFR